MSRFGRYVLTSRPVNSFLRRIADSVDDASAADLVFVRPPAANQGWILDRYCEELGQRMGPARIIHCRSGEPLPAARHYFFSHYMYYVSSFAWRSPIHAGKSHIWATHLEPEKHGIDNDQLVRALNCCQTVICMNRALRDELENLGVFPDRLAVALGAADTRRFRPHRRSPNGRVGFCSAYYERKSPNLIFEVVRRMPHRNFTLLGKGWASYPRFSELVALANFEYLETEYDDYGKFYAGLSVFVSASRLEGGPVPLLEAMMCNVVPVASRTGFAPDLIQDGSNGWLFEIDADPVTVCDLIERAYRLETDVHETVADYGWDGFSRGIGGLLKLPVRV
jgi:glycosyltransferase involved in cell wall biosynthesis